MKEPKAIAFTGDWHANASWAVMTIQAVAEAGADTVVNVGDYGFTFSRQFIDAVEKACRDNDVNIYFIDGNHDNHEKLWSLVPDEDGFGVLSNHVRYIPRGHRWRWWDLDFVGLGGATSVDRPDRVPHVSWWPTEAVTNSDAYRTAQGGSADVMIAHDCPADIPIPGISLEEGLKHFRMQELLEADKHRELMRSIVDEVKPKVYIHGHYHRAYGYRDTDGCRYIGLDMDGTNHNVWLVRESADILGDPFTE